MADAAREYELVLMLDPGLEDSVRDKLADAARKQIGDGGELRHEDDWGVRKMAYEIRQRTEADYRWFRFSAPTQLLGQLDHSLKIADGVLRYRLFRVDPGAPVIAPPASSSPAPRAEPPPETPPSEAPPETPPSEAPPEEPAEAPQESPAT